MRIDRVRRLRIIQWTLVLAVAAVVTGCATDRSVTPSDTEPRVSAEVKRITRILTTTENDLVQVVIQSDRLLTYTSVKQPYPLGVLLYFPETALGPVSPRVAADNPLIKRIDVSELTDKGHTARLEIALKDDVPYEVIRDGNGLRVSFRMPEAGPAAAPADAKIEDAASAPAPVREETAALPAAAPPKTPPAAVAGDEDETVSAVPAITATAAVADGAAQPVQSALDVAAADGPTDTASAAAAPAAGTAWLNRVDFSSEPGGRSTVIVGTTHPVTYRLDKGTDRRLHLTLFDTRVPAHRQRPLITTRFPSAVDRILPIQVPGPERTAAVAVELRESVPYFIEQDAEVITLHFEASGIPPKPFETAGLPDWQQVMQQTVAAVQTGAAMPAEIGAATEPAAAPAAAEPVAGDSLAAQIAAVDRAPVYSGEKIALDFYETDIKNVFRILREVSGKNFAIDKNVTGKVTLSFEKPVPWDQVLDLILKMNQLGKVLEGDIIRIATLSTLKQEEVLRSEKLNALRQAREDKKAVEPMVTEYIAINYSNAQNDILPHIKNILTEGRGSISVDERTNVIILTDTAEKLRQAREIVQQLDRVTPQVVIEARIVEALTDFAREIGTEWGTGVGVQESSLLSVDGLTAGVTSELNDRVGEGPERGYDALGGTYGLNMAMNFPTSSTASGAGAIGFNFVRIAGTPFLLNAKLMALESRGEGKLISAPKIVTLDNKKATIRQGLRYPYFKLDESGNTTLEFEEIDLTLEVTPHVTLDRRISMTINIAKKDLGNIINNQQSFTTKEATTELLVDDGDTVVIGGIIKSVQNFGETGLPWAQNIPIVGWLFKTRSKSHAKEELLIFITPRIVQLEQRNVTS